MTATIHGIVDEGLGNASWLIELGDWRALVVDPSRDPTPYLDLARERGLRITHAAETHLHADFVSGSQELAARGAQVLGARAARLQFAHQGLDDDEEVDLGGLRLRVLATPGHTPEHLAFLLLDGQRPVALFSGGALLVGGVARTDLISPDQTGPLTQAAWRSLRERLLRLPDDLPVHPTHGAGSFCSTGGGSQRTTTIGAERAGNPLLRGRTDEAEFTERLLGSLGSYPPYFLRLREINRQGARLLDERALALPKLSPEQVERERGAVLVDARGVEAFAAGHPAGALSIALRPAFASWLGWLVSPDQPLMFVLDDDQDRAELVRQCHKIGYERLLGELAGGLAAWHAAGLPEGHIELVEADHVDGNVLDVRQASEVAAGHLPGATLIELGALDPHQPLPSGPLTVMCGHSERAMTAASLLAQSGRGELRVLLGGPDDWSAATGTPLVSA
jgi:hydroxyacylglutathione hydrolase